MAAAPPPVTSALASYSQAELLIGAGALLILLTDLLFGVFGDYSFSNVAWIAAAVSLILIALNGRLIHVSANTYRTALIVLGLLAVLIGVRELIADLVFIPGRSLSATFFLGMVGFYVGIALMAFGAFRLWSSRAA